MTVRTHILIRPEMDSSLHLEWHRFLWQQFFVACSYWASAVVMFYDLFLTFDRELSYVWGARISRISLAYFIMRYIPLAGIVPELIFSPPWQRDFTTDCNLPPFDMAFNILPFCAGAGIASLRIYALYSRNVFLAMFVLVLCLLTPAMNVYGLVTSALSYSQGDIRTCRPAFLHTAIDYEFLLLLSRLPSILTNVVLVVLMWKKTVRTKMEAMRVNHRASLITVILSDGTLYFLAIVAHNVAAIVGGHTWGASAAYVDAMDVWMVTIVSILTCRFVLDLREAAVLPAEPGLAEVT